MATAMKAKTKTAKAATDVNETVIEEAVKTDSTSKSEPVKTEKPAKKEYKATDGIPCRSIASGALFMEGLKSHILYQWIDNGDVVEVEYQDLVAAIRSNNAYIIRPFFVIEDEELVSQYPQVGKVYDALYTVGDLRSVLTDLGPEDMRATIATLPVGAQNTIKHLASQMISNGTLDSVRKIKVLDDIYDTEMILLTGLFHD